MAKEYECPKCGKLTNGSYSEGGLKWPICDECMIQEQKMIRDKRKDWLCDCGRTLATEQEREEGLCYSCQLPTCDGCGEPLEDYRERQVGYCAECLNKQKTLPFEEVKS